MWRSGWIGRSDDNRDWYNFTEIAAWPLRKAEDEVQRGLTLALPLTLLTGLSKEIDTVYSSSWTKLHGNPQPAPDSKHRKRHQHEQISPISQILLHKPDTLENRRVKASVIFSSFVSLSTLAYLSTFLPSNSDNDRWTVYIHRLSQGHSVQQYLLLDGSFPGSCFVATRQLIRSITISGVGWSWGRGQVRNCKKGTKRHMYILPTLR